VKSLAKFDLLPIYLKDMIKVGLFKEHNRKEHFKSMIILRKQFKFWQTFLEVKANFSECVPLVLIFHNYSSVTLISWFCTQTDIISFRASLPSFHYSLKLFDCNWKSNAEKRNRCKWILKWKAQLIHFVHLTFCYFIELFF
jgi:hypothetical protein